MGLGIVAILSQSCNINSRDSHTKDYDYFKI